MNKSINHFIIGIGRSGTTLLMNILNTHPAILAFPEINFFNFFYWSWRTKTSFTQADLKAIRLFLNYFTKRAKNAPYKWDEEQFLKAINSLTTVNFASVYEAFYNSFIFNGQVKKTEIIFDKNPVNTLYIPEIIKTFPKAKFILMVRDPRANYLSRKQKVLTSPEIYFNCYRWNLYNKTALNFKQQYPDKIILTRYENLVLNPEEEIKKIASFFDFQYTSEMLEFYQTVKQTRDIEAIVKSDEKGLLKDKFEKLSQPVNTSRLNSWKTELTEKEIEIISFICNTAANQSGYSLSNDKQSGHKITGYIKSRIDLYRNKLIFYLPLWLKLKLIKDKSL